MKTKTRRLFRRALGAALFVQLSGCCCCDGEVSDEFVKGFQEGFNEEMQKQVSTAIEAEAEKAEEAEEAEPAAAKKTKKAAKGTFKKKSFAVNKIPLWFPGEGGDPVGGVRFDDANGDNVLVLVQDGPHLLAVHRAHKNGKTKVLREVSQKKSKCEYDYFSSFDLRALSATDLDNDGYGEATFAYRTNCASDVSPSDYKVLVLENGEKSILRGTDIVDVGGGERYGDGKFKAEGFKGKPKLLAHAKKTWKKTVFQK